MSGRDYSRKELSGKFLAVLKTCKNEYLVEVNSEEEAVQIVNEKYGNACKNTGFFSEKYSVRRPNKIDNLDLYEVCN